MVINNKLCQQLGSTHVPLAYVQSSELYSIGSGGSCGDTAGSRYCGQALNFVTGIVGSIPICDCTAPFAITTITDDKGDAASDKSPNRGNL